MKYIKLIALSSIFGAYTMHATESSIQSPLLPSTTTSTSSSKQCCSYTMCQNAKLCSGMTMLALLSSSLFYFATLSPSPHPVPPSPIPPAPQPVVCQYYIEAGSDSCSNNCSTDPWHRFKLDPMCRLTRPQKQVTKKQLEIMCDGRVWMNEYEWCNHTGFPPPPPCKPWDPALEKLNQTCFSPEPEGIQQPSQRAALQQRHRAILAVMEQQRKSGNSTSIQRPPSRWRNATTKVKPPQKYANATRRRLRG